MTAEPVLQGPFFSRTDELLVVVDTPRGSPVKFKYDEERGIFTIARFLPGGLVFPFDFGFFPGTRAEDGDALDAVLLTEETGFTGRRVRSRLMGVLEARQKKKGRVVRDDRLITVASDSAAYRQARTLEDVGREQLEGIERFFIASNEEEGREFQPLGFFDAGRARATLMRSLLTPGGRRRRQR
jgi:inorganic pyrophosphatase